MTRQPQPKRCRKLLVNSNNGFFCIAPFADDITNEKCIEGKGECEFRDVPAIHTSAPAPSTVVEDITFEGAAIVQAARAEAAKAAREKVLEELGTMLNSRIAKMEIICSKSKTPLREGILMAYREIEGWEMQQRKESLRTHQQQQQGVSER